MKYGNYKMMYCKKCGIKYIIPEGKYDDHKCKKKDIKKFKQKQNEATQHELSSKINEQRLESAIEKLKKVLKWREH